jgi:dihydrofolate reductase
MRKLVAFNHVTLDGYACGPQGELEWANAGEEIYADVEPRIHRIGAAVYGRITYGMMAGYWPTVLSDPESSAKDRAHAVWVEAIPKVVVSRSLERADWNNTTLIRDHVKEQVETLKRQPGGDLMVFGSPNLVHVLARLGLVDEYLIYVNPVALGGGTPLFEAGTAAKLELLETKPFDAGVIQMRYAVESN